MNFFANNRLGLYVLTLLAAVIALASNAPVNADPPALGTISPTITAKGPSWHNARLSALSRNSQTLTSADAIGPQRVSVFNQHALTPHQANIPVVLNSPVQTTDLTLPTYANAPPPFVVSPITGVPAGANAPTNIDPVWSHDGTFIIFASNRTSVTNPKATGDYHLFYLKATGYNAADPSSFVQLTGLTNPTGSSERYPTLVGLNDTLIIYCSAPSPAGPYTIQSGSFGTSPPTIFGVTPLASGLDARHPSGVGGSIIFAGRAPNDNVYHIWTLTQSNGNTILTQLTSGSADEENPSFSPDGTLVSFDSSASAYVQNGSTPLTSSGAPAAKRGVWISALSGVGISELTNPTSNSIEPAWSPPGTNPYLNPLNVRQYCFFSSDRVNGKYAIYFLRAESSGQSNQAVVDDEGQSNSGLGANTAVAVNVSDISHSYNDYSPQVVVPPLGNPTVIFSSDRYLVNGVNDNPLGDSSNPQDLEPVNYPASPNTIPPSTPSPQPNEVVNNELMSSRIFDISPPTLVRYNELTTEVVHIENVINPGVASKFVTPGQTAAIVVRLSDRQSGLQSVYLQIKDPDSKYQDAGHLEHKVFTRNSFPDSFPGLDISQQTHNNEYNEAISLGNSDDVGASGIDKGQNFGQILRAVAYTANIAGGNQATTTSMPAVVGSTALTVASPAALSVGQAIVIGTGNQAEQNSITAIAGNVITVAVATIRPHPAGTPIIVNAPTTATTGNVTNAYTVGVINAGIFEVGDSVVIDGVTTEVTSVNFTNKTITLFSPISVGTGTVITRTKTRTFDRVGAEVDCQALDMTAPSPFDATNPVNYVVPVYTPGFEDSNVYSGTTYTPPPSPNNAGTYWLQMQPLSTTLSVAAVASTSPVNLTVNLSSGFVAGDTILIDPGPNQESQIIQSISGNTITVGALTNSHANGVSIIEQKSVGGGVLYIAQWNTPNIPSDYYLDVIAYDPANWPIPYSIGATGEGGQSNWRIFDNVGGLTTLNFVTKSGILIVGDYSLPQKFFGRGGETSSANEPAFDFGAESYLTDIETNFDDPIYTAKGMHPPVALPSHAYSFPPTYNGVSGFGNPIVDGNNINLYGEIGFPPSEQSTLNFDYFQPGYANGLGVNSYADQNMGDAATFESFENGVTPNPQSGQYDLWRVLSRGPVPVNVIAAYAPRIDVQPADPTVGGSTTKNVLVASGCIIWQSPATGDEFAEQGTLADTTTQENLINYLVGGGRLFVEGVDVGFALANNNSSIANQFYNNYLNAIFVSDTTGDRVISTFVLAGGTAQTDYVTFDAYTNSILKDFNRNNDLDPVGHNGFGFPGTGDPIQMLYNPPAGGGQRVTPPPPPLTVSHFGGVDPASGQGPSVTQDGSLDADISIPNTMDQFSEELSAALEPIELHPTDASKAGLVYSGSPLKNVIPAGASNAVGSIVVYSSIPVESLSQYIEKWTSPNFNGNAQTLYVCDNQRTNLLHNLVCFMRTGRLSGQIVGTNSGGQGIAGAIVRCTLSPVPTAISASPVYTALTGADGTYQVDGLPPGRYAVDAYYSPTGSSTNFEHIAGGEVYLHGGDTAALNLLLNQPAPATITVALQDANSLVPIVGGTVTLSEAGGTFVYTANTDSFGNAAFANVIPNTYAISATAPTYSPFSAPLTTTTAAITAGAASSGLVVASSAGLSAGQTIEVDSGANAETVTITAVNGTAISTTPFTKSHASGVGVFGAQLTTSTAALAAAATAIVVGNVTPFTVGETVLVDSGANSEPVTISAINAATETLTVSALTLAHAAGVGVFPELTTASQAITPTSSSTVQVASVQGFKVGQLIVIDTGANSEAVTITAVGATSLTTTPFALNHSAGVGIYAAILIGPGANPTVTEQLTPQPGSITGLVTDSTNPALDIPGATITLLSAAGVIDGLATTNSSGVYSIQGVVAGNYTLSVAAPGYDTAGAAVTIVRGTQLTENVSLTPAPPTGIAGIVVDATDAAALAGVNVTLTDTSGNPIGQPTTTAADGSYAFQKLSPGTYVVTVAKNGYETKSQTVSIVSGQIRTGVNFSLFPAGSLVVNVVDQNGAPIQGVTVSAVNTGGSPSYGPTTTSANGQASFSAVEVGSYDITVTGDAKSFFDGALYSQAVTQGATTTVTISLVPLPAQIDGTVLTSDPGQPDDGNPIPNATVTFSIGANVIKTVQSDASGNFTTEPGGVPAGTYSVEATAANYSPSTPQTETVSQGQNKSGVALTLHPVAVLYGLVYRFYDNEPVGNVTLNLYDSSGTLVATTVTGATFTGRDGSPANFLFSGEPVGSYTLAVVDPNYMPVANISVELPTGGTRVTGDIPLSPLHVFNIVQNSSSNFGLQMISEPYDFTAEGAGLSDLLGGLPNPIMAVWLPRSNSYAVTPTPPADTFHRGVGYWIRLKQVAGLVGVPDPQASTPFGIALSPTWNMVGDPWSQSVSMSNIVVSDTMGTTYNWATASSGAVNLVSPVIYSYDAGNNVYVPHYVGNTAEPNPTIDPYVGYWFQAFTNCSLQVPKP